MLQRNFWYILKNGDENNYGRLKQKPFINFT